jgi:uncharacterized Zn finger protein (UPF0148 family)
MQANEVAEAHAGVCPRCGGLSLAGWYDGDLSCWTCGTVVYRVRPLSQEEAMRQRAIRRNGDGWHRERRRPTN